MSHSNLNNAQTLIGLRDELRDKKYEKIDGLDRISRAEDNISSTFSKALEKAKGFNAPASTSSSSTSSSTSSSSTSSSSTSSSTSTKGGSPTPPKVPSPKKTIKRPFNAKSYMGRYQAFLVSKRLYDNQVALDVSTSTFNNEPVKITGQNQKNVQVTISKNGALFVAGFGLQNFMFSTNVEWLDTADATEASKTIEHYLTLLYLTDVSEMSIDSSYRQTLKYKAIQSYMNLSGIKGKPFEQANLQRAAVSTGYIKPRGKRSPSPGLSPSLSPSSTDDESSSDEPDLKEFFKTGSSYGSIYGSSKQVCPHSVKEKRGFGISGDKFGDIFIDMQKLGKKNVLHVTKNGKVKMHSSVSDKTSRDLIDLLTRRRMNTKRKYTAESLSLFSKLKNLSKVNTSNKFSHKLSISEDSLGYMDSDDLLHRIGLLSASMQSGNESSTATQELRNMVRELKNRGILSEDEYNEIIMK